MAKALTQTQLNYLNWLHQDNVIAVCIEYSNQFGKMSYSSQPTFKTDNRALQNLKLSGFIQEQDTYEFGIRWTRFTLSERGHKVLEAQTCL
ncbi:hypothetical protein LCGC14_1555700 [marine sediment metagenome]|uniref:Uncharacterized protein n=1 Tax=marine sediment metagenome TaxID=412755 RepID=A0A0F9INZ9_9ZZZZ